MGTDVLIPNYQRIFSEIAKICEDSRRMLAESYWRIGQLIVEVEQDGDVRAAYGQGTLKRLSQDLSINFGEGFSVKNLERMRMFYLTYSKSSAPTKLAWTQYIELLAVTDGRTRRKFENMARKEGLSARDIRRLVKGNSAAAQAVPVPLAPAGTPVAPVASLPAAAPGLSSPSPSPSSSSSLVPLSSSTGPVPALERPTGLVFGTYREVADSALTAPEGTVFLDLGFFVEVAVPRSNLATLALCAKPAYTYPAMIERVIDGDTLLVSIELGFGIIVRERLRLRGINTPELGTPDGEGAKYYVEDILPRGTRVVVKSHQTDVYGRFVADVFFRPGIEDTGRILMDGLYLNQELMDRGLAVRMVA